MSDAIDLNISDEILNYFNPGIYENFYILKDDFFDILISKRIYPFTLHLSERRIFMSYRDKEDICLTVQLFLEYLRNNPNIAYSYKTFLVLSALYCSLEFCSSSEKYRTTIILYKKENKFLLYFPIMHSKYCIMFNLNKMDDIITLKSSTSAYDLFYKDIDTIGENLASYSLSSFFILDKKIFENIQYFRNSNINHYLNVMYVFISALYSVIEKGIPQDAEDYDTPIKAIVRDFYYINRYFRGYTSSCAYMTNVLEFLSSNNYHPIFDSTNGYEIERPESFVSTIPGRDNLIACFKDINQAVLG